mgnify:CR=1 FL=1
MTPLGMTFSEMASMTGGGVQTPGFMGHGKHFIASKKFMKAEGGIGSDAAIEAADIVIMNDELSKLPVAIKYARMTMKTVKENVWFALGVKAVVLILAALGYANMWLAVFADVGVALLAILNATKVMRK